MNLREWEHVLLRVTFHWMTFKVLGTLHLHGEAFQEAEPVILSRIT